MTKKNIDLLIIEKGNDLSFGKDQEYTYEGPFTSLGVKNKNRRIYEKEGFIPHLEGLQSQIKENKLLGELDHPKDFEIMLSRASHVIEDLKLDESGNTVLGRIKLLDTAKGKDAKAIADAGVPLHISSRAAGTVNESGVVTIKKLFTYDLVADPGFANAQLSKVSESLNVDEERAQEIVDMVTESHNYDSEELVLINEKFGLSDEDGVDIYQIVKKSNDTIKEEKENKSSELSKESNEKVTVEQLTKWSNVFVGEIQEMINSKIEESSKANNDVSEIKSFMDSFSTEMQEKMSNFNNFVNYLSEGMNSLKEHNDYIIEGMNSLKEHNNYIVENLDLLKGYSEKAHMEIADVKEHNDHIVKMSNKLTEFANHVGEKTNQSINYAESISEGASKLTEFVEHVAENLLQVKESNETLEEKLSSFNIDDINNDKIDKKQEDSPSEQVEESIVVEDSEYQNSLTSKLDEILENAKKAQDDAINKTSNDNKLFGLLNENYKTQYETLPENKKQKLKEVFESNELSTETEAEELFNSTVNEDKSLNWVDNMPENLKETWNNLNESVKQKIELQASNYDLDTQARINWFWSTRNLSESKKPVLNKAINESIKSEDDSLGYVVNAENLIKAVKNIHG